MKPWYLSQNPFFRATVGNFLCALNISTFHDSALAAAKSDPAILILYNAFHPLHLAFKSGYDAWKLQGGTQQGETLNTNQLLKLLSVKIKRWDVAIQNVYAPDTPEYKKLLPKHRTPFQKGSLTERLSAVNVLDDALGNYTSLAAVKTDVGSFQVQLNEATTVQKGAKNTTKSLSTSLEEARVAMCTGQFVNLGALIQKYPTSPAKIEHFFDLQSIRHPQQVLFSGHVKPGEIYTILKHTFAESDELVLTNSGNVPLTFYLANSKGMQPGDKSLTVNPGTGDQTVLASALGKLTDAFLTVFNPDALQTGAFSVDMV